MHLVVGLGNPGAEYARHRHNVGFMAVEAIAAKHGFPPFRSRFQGLVSEGRLGGERVALLLPQTYMNESGRSVQAAARFYKIAPSEVVVIHDELDLAPGKIRVKRGGGAAGHNGLRSIDALFANDYWRLRIGIGHPGADRVLGWVLHDFFTADREWLVPLLEAIAAGAPALVEGDPQKIANRVALALQPPKPDKQASNADKAAGRPAAPREG